MQKPTTPRSQQLHTQVCVSHMLHVHPRLAGMLSIHSVQQSGRQDDRMAPAMNPASPGARERDLCQGMCWSFESCSLEVDGSQPIIRSKSPCLTSLQQVETRTPHMNGGDEGRAEQCQSSNDLRDGKLSSSTLLEPAFQKT